MKRRTSVSHHESIVRRLRKDPNFAAEYLKAALEDEDEPRVLLVALRHLAGVYCGFGRQISKSSFFCVL